MACPFAAPAFLARVLVTMQLLRATLALSAIPSSGDLATSLGSAAPSEARTQFMPKTAGSFLQRADPSLDLAKFNEEAEAINKKIDTLELQCKMMQMKDDEILSGLNRQLRAISGQLAGNIALESGAASQAKQERAQSTKLKEQLGKAKSMCKMQVQHLQNSVDGHKKDEDKTKALHALSSQCDEEVLELVSINKTGPAMPAASLLQGCGEEVTAPMRAAVKALEQEAHFSTAFAKQAFSDALRHASAGSSFPVLLEADRSWPGKSKPPSRAKLKKGTACAMKPGSPNCGLLKSQLDTMLQHMEEQKDLSVTRHRKQVEDCTNSELELNNRIKSTDAQYARTSTDLTRLTGLKAGLSASRASIQQRLDRTERDSKKSTQTCKDGVSQYKGELDDTLGKRQSEATQQAGKRVIIQDCQVTEWVGSKCSKACKEHDSDAAGHMNFTRSVNQNAGLEGYSCPPFTAKLPCGDKPCPVDCIVSEWTAWGACSKACSGGTAKRNRKITTQMKDGGKSCPGIEMRKACNVGSCSDPCTLKKWTPWSACSRRCKFSKTSAAGRSRRVREVEGNPIQTGGASSCPPATDITRLQTRKCNNQVCPQGITCDASQDVVFLLDGSGDAGYDFETQVNFVSEVVAASSDNVRFGVLSYGKEVKILSRITADRNQINAMTAYTPPTGGTRDSVKGMFVGRSLFADPGGGGGPKIAVLLLGGSPASYVNAKKASEELRSAGVRVVVGLVDDGSPQARTHACGLASSPCSANVEAVKSWRQMADEPGRFLTTICKDLVYPTKAPSRLDSMVKQ